jgi:hypothetical protein
MKNVVKIKIYIYIMDFKYFFFKKKTIKIVVLDFKLHWAESGHVSNCEKKKKL